MRRKSGKTARAKSHLRRGGIPHGLLWLCNGLDNELCNFGCATFGSVVYYD